MKRELVIIIFILVMLFCVNFITINLLKKSSDELSDLIYEVNASIELNDDAKYAIEKLRDKWEDVNKVWAIVVTHQELDQIDLSLISAIKAIEKNDFDDAVIELGKLEFLLKHINEKEAFMLKNIF